MSALRRPDDPPEEREQRRLQLVEEVTARLVEEDETVEQASAEVQAAIEQARGVEIRTAEDAANVEEILARLKAQMNGLEARRRHLKAPHLEGGRRVDEMFRELSAPLQAADRELRPKLIAWDEEQRRLAQAEQERLDRERAEREAAAEEERRKAAAAAQAAREAAAREQALADEEARLAEQRRREQLDEEADDLRRRAAQSTDENLQSVAGRDDKYGEAARAELADRRAAREAKERQARAAAAVEAAERAEEEARSAPLPVLPRAEVPVPAATTKTASGQVQRKRRFVVEIVDASRLPRRWLVPDEKAIREFVLAGGEIPGVRRREVFDLAVKAS